MHLDYFNGQQCQRGGIRWYTPDAAGPPTLIELADRVSLGYVFALYPTGPDGFRIERPGNLDILDAQLKGEAIANAPFDHAANADSLPLKQIRRAPDGTLTYN